MMFASGADYVKVDKDDPFRRHNEVSFKDHRWYGVGNGMLVLAIPITITLTTPVPRTANQQC